MIHEKMTIGELANSNPELTRMYYKFFYLAEVYDDPSFPEYILCYDDWLKEVSHELVSTIKSQLVHLINTDFTDLHLEDWQPTK